MSARIPVVVIVVQTMVICLALGLGARPGVAAPEPPPERATLVENAVAAQVSAANAQGQPILPATLGISLAEARVIIDAAVAYAKGVNGSAGTAVLDGAGNVVSLDRMDGASYQQDRQAAGKARIAVMLRQRSSISAGLIETQPDRFFSVLSMYPGEIYWQAGGVPLAVDGRLVGGVGISGLVGGQDEPAADAGIEAWQRYRESLAR